MRPFIAFGACDFRFNDGLKMRTDRRSQSEECHLSPVRLLKLVFVLFAMLSPVKQVAAAAGGGVPSVVIADESVVYSAPSFDAPPIGGFRRGQIVFTSRRTFGSDVTFFRVRLGNRLGYIVTIDVDRREVSVQRAQRRAEVQRKRAEQRDERKTGTVQKKPANSPPSKPTEPYVFTRYFGVSVGSTLFREEIPGLEAQDRLTTLGLKLTGPDVIIKGPLVDFNLAFSQRPPAYYEPASVVPPTGVVVLSDLLLLAPYRAQDNWAFYGGLGPHLSLVSVRLVGTDRVRSVTALNLGIALYLGIGGRWGKWSARFEAKQIYERRGYQTVLLAIQNQLW